MAQHIGRYPVVEEIGRGGMGVVYRAHDPQLDRPVAIKVLSESWALNSEHVERFRREARILARFNHPNIATIYGLGETDAEEQFLVLEFIEGESLGARLRSQLPRSADVWAIGSQIAAALHAAHRREVIHRDLKPDNVLIDLEGVAKVLDFGLAKSVGPDDAEGPSASSGASLTDDTVEVQRGFDTQPGIAMGTPNYMSPEQLRGQALTPSTDLFSLGCLLFECLTGATPFAADNLSDQIAATLTREPAWNTLPTSTPAVVVDLLRGLLAKEANERLHDSGEIAALLRDVDRGSSSIRVAEQRRATPHNLPSQASTFVGRTRELEELQTLLAETRVLTLTGSGGSGKTRLALEVAERRLDDHPDGVWLVTLAEIESGRAVAARVKTALSIRDEAAPEAIVDLIAERLAESRVLLILDNCEHVLAECADLVSTLLGRCSGLRVLVTSRESLGVAGETTFSVPSLAFDADGVLDPARLEGFDAVRLFVDRARSARPGFRLDDDSARWVGQICARLDGIPLAIELAAARVRAMPPEKIAQRLEQSFRILTGGSRTALPRQQTVRATFDWSYNLLSGAERVLLRRLSVFGGGCTLEAVERVCADPDEEGGSDTEDALPEWEVLDRLTALVEKSLVLYHEASDRYRLLATAREFGREELAKDADGGAVRTRHAEFFVDLAEEAAPHLIAVDQREWLERLDTEFENLRVALEWSSVSGEASCAIRIVAAIWRFWNLRGHAPFGLESAERSLAECREPSLARAHALNGAGVLARSCLDLDRATSYQLESLAVAEEIGDVEARAQAGYSVGVLHLVRPDSDVETARGFFESALELFRQAGDDRGVASALNSLGWVKQSREDFDAAEAHYREALELRRRAGDLNGVATTTGTLALLALDRGDPVRARELLEESLALYTDLAAKSGRGWVLQSIAMLDREEGDVRSASARLEESLALRREVSDERGAVSARLGLIDARMETEEPVSVRASLLDSLTYVKELDVPYETIFGLEVSAHYLHRCGRSRDAFVLLARADQMRADLQNPFLLRRFTHLDGIRQTVEASGEDLERLSEEASARTVEETVALAERWVSST